MSSLTLNDSRVDAGMYNYSVTWSFLRTYYVLRIGPDSLDYRRE